MRAHRSAAFSIFSARSAILSSLASSLSSSAWPTSTERRIVELVRDARKQFAQRTQFLALVQEIALAGKLRLGFATFGQVAATRDRNFAAVIVDLPVAHRCPEQGAVGPLELDLDIVQRALLAKPVDQNVALAVIGEMCRRIGGFAVSAHSRPTASAAAGLS